MMAPLVRRKFRTSAVREPDNIAESVPVGSAKPSLEALDRALTLLMDDINDKSNKSDGAASPESGIASFDVQVSVLHDLKLHIDRHVRTLARRRNAHLPVNKLPTELVIHILTYTLPGDLWGIRKLQPLAQVQVRWWEIILSHARFWTSLHFGISLETIALKIRRSQNAPLDIGTLWPEEERYQPFHDLIAPHAHRWRTFAPWECPLESVRECLETPLPLLERLRIWGTGKGPKFLNLAGGPRLRHVHIGGFEIPLETGVLSNLLSLSFHSITDTSLKTALPGILQACPNLEEFGLEYIKRGSSLDGSTMELHSPLSLPNLKSLRLFKVTKSLSSPLLRHLRPNEACSYTVFQDQSASTALESLDLLLSPRSNDPSIMQSIFSMPYSYVGFAFYDDHIEISGHPSLDSTSFGSHQIRLHIDSWPALTGMWVDRFPLASPTFQDVKFWYRGIADASVERPIFDTLPTVRLLDLKADVQRALRIIRRLREPKPEEDGGNVWRWPRLERIDLHVWSDPKLGTPRQHKFLTQLSGLIEDRENLEGVSPVKVYHRIGWGGSLMGKELVNVWDYEFAEEDSSEDEDDDENDGSDDGEDEANDEDFA